MHVCILTHKYSCTVCIFDWQHYIDPSEAGPSSITGNIFFNYKFNIITAIFDDQLVNFFISTS